MTSPLLARAPKNAIPLVLLTEKHFRVWLKKQPKSAANALETQGFKGKPGSFGLIQNTQGKLARVVAGISDTPSLWDIADFSTRLPEGTYKLESDLPLAYREWLSLGWVLGAYRFTRYKKSTAVKAKLVLTEGADAAKIERYASSICLARTLVTTPAEDMGPQDLAAAATEIAKKHGAKITQIIGDDLLKKNYPAIHRVGRSGMYKPRLIDLTWGKTTDPKITLVGKGVTFDTGGLDIKPTSAMALMKKDMAGAACTLALAAMIMDAKLPVRLRVLIPAAENAISSNAFRPGDVITMRDGTTVEIGNTDAEGRLVLADAITEAVTEKPDLLINFATLVGAKYGALGADIPALFCNDDMLAEKIYTAAQEMEDPLWRLPLYQPYKKMLDSPIADLNNTGNSPYAGAITAALFLQHFVGEKTKWVYIDMMAYNLSSRPGRPEGGEAQGVRAIFRVIESLADASRAGG